MRLLFDFKCSEGHITESLVNSTENTAQCKVCEATATKIISPIRCKLDPLSGHFPGETEKWAKARQKRINEERKTTADHGYQDWGQ
jgi:hypothetical protein